ncbi:MAG: divergent PAP2 family protein [Clostridia bacterium]|nr:divergent PAP2 family protein [Clostridia bacterium]
MISHILIASLSAWLIAQLLKIIIGVIVDKKLDFVKLWSSGGMPSSHSSTVCALATACAYSHGFASTEFAIATILAVVVMYDAAGVRRAVGEQAKILNNINNSLPDEEPRLMQKNLKELIGHTPLQVVLGALLGVLIGFFYPWLTGVIPFYAA